MFADSPQLITVLLRHELPDGSAHIDWMLTRGVDSNATLQTFRCDSRVDELKPGQAIEIDEIDDHRRAYLDYEGPLSNHRGTISRLRRGVALILDDQPGTRQLSIVWDDRGSPACEQTIDLRCGRGGRWVVRSVHAGAAIVQE